MPAPKKPKTTPEKQTGAPANARLLEDHAADAEREVVRIKGEIASLVSKLPQFDSDLERTKDINDSIQGRRADLNDAYDLWFKLSKQVLDYDKKVDAARREGESIPRLLVETILTQSWRFQRIGRESFIVAISQEAIRCKDEQDFYSKYAEALRQCETTALKDAIEHEKAPGWVLQCFLNSL